MDSLYIMHLPRFLYDSLDLHCVLLSYFVDSLFHYFIS